MSTKKESKIIPEDKLALYLNLIATDTAIERKGATLPYTSVNGNMFTFLSKEGELSLRLPETERDQFMKKYKAKLSRQHGVMMKEYVLVPETLFKRTGDLKPYLDKSFEYAKTLKAKPSKKSKE